MNGTELIGVDWATLIDGLTNHINDSSEGLRSDGDHDRALHVLDLLATDKTFSRVERNSAHVVTTEMLGNFEDETIVGALDLEGIENRR